MGPTETCMGTTDTLLEGFRGTTETAYCSGANGDPPPRSTGLNGANGYYPNLTEPKCRYNYPQYYLCSLL